MTEQQTPTITPPPAGVRFDEDGRPRYPEMRPPVEGESSREARERRDLNRKDRAEWSRWIDMRCARCGEVRHHVNHEPNPETSIEGPDYYASFIDELHPFEEMGA